MKRVKGIAYFFDYATFSIKQNTIENLKKGGIPSFLQKGNLGIAKNYRHITLIAITAKIYNPQLLNCIRSEIEKILLKNQNSFQRNCSTATQLLTIYQIIKRVQAKNHKLKLLFIDFAKVFNSIHREKMEQILLAYHHVALSGRIFLTLSRHTFLSSIAFGRSSGLHPISAQSGCM